MGTVTVPVIAAGVAKRAEVIAAITAVANEFNGNIDNTNIKTGAAIDGAKLAAASVTPAQLSAIKLSGVGGSYTSAPSAPGINGAFLMQAGTDVVTFASNSAVVTLATPFPNGILMAVAVQGDNSAGTGVGFNVATTSTKAGIALNCASNGIIRVNWIAIGW